MGSSSRARCDALMAVVQAHGPGPALEWLSRGLPAPDGDFNRGLFFGFFAGAGRRFARAADGDFTPAPGELSALEAAGVQVPAAFRLSDLVRAALLLAATDVLPPEEHVGLVREAVLKGDTDERVAALRALSLLPNPARFVELAIDSCRSHVQDVFEAVARDNPYPAAHFPDASFNQLVMKALFTEVPLDRVFDWRSRNNAELARMAGDYEAERRAAGRSVPGDIGSIQETNP